MNLEAKTPTFFKSFLKIEKVVDGDGIIVRNIFDKKVEEIRLLGIDAPELKPCRKLIRDEKEKHIAGELLMELGRMSFQFLLSQIEIGEEVTAEIEEKNQFDKYGRTLAYIYLKNGDCLNQRLIEEGFAKPLNDFYCNNLATYQLLHNKAKQNKRGLFKVINTF